MSTITFPTLSLVGPMQVEVGLKSNTAIFVSPLSGDTQSLELPGARWTMSFSFPPLLDDDAAELEAFLAQLRGQANRARVPLWGRETPRGTWAGTAAVNGASQTGASLICDGFTAGATVKRGDMFNVGTAGELKRIVTDGTADGSGNLTIEFEPPLRNSPATDTVLVSSNPLVPYMIVQDPHLRSMRGLGGLTDVAFDLMEVFS